MKRHEMISATCDAIDLGGCNCRTIAFVMVHCSLFTYKVMEGQGRREEGHSPTTMSIWTQPMRAWPTDGVNTETSESQVSSPQSPYSRP
jgi:hypothetical protein